MAMAWVEKRPTKKKSVVRWRVKWREGGRRGSFEDGRTFDSDTEARAFKALVDLSGQHFPPDELLSRHGFAYLVTAQPAPAAEAVPEGQFDPSTVLFEPYAVSFVEGLTRPSKESKRKYLERLERHVFPVLGQRPVSAITRREMRAWQGGLVKPNGEPLGRKTIANLRGESMFPIFEASCLPGEDGEPPLRSYNPLRGLDLPTVTHPFVREILETEDEAALFLRIAYELYPDAADLLVTLLAGGFRWGEGAAITKRSVDERRGTVAVRWVLVREGNQWSLRPGPKTEDGFRQIPLPDRVMAMLLARCENLKPNDFVFTAPGGNFWRYAQFYDGRWAKIRDRYQAETGVWITMYGLRHSVLTYLGESDIDLVALRLMAGHKHFTTTYNLYIHTTRKHHPAVKASTSAFLRGLPSGQAS
jgi:integrase